MGAGSSRSCCHGPGARLLLALLTTLPLVACAVTTSNDRLDDGSTGSSAADSSAGRGGMADAGGRQPTGVVRVAYPEEPSYWYPAVGEEPSSIDLAALWGLPLYRIDPHGQLRPALAESSEVRPGSEGMPWEVDVRLRSGSGRC